MQKKSKKAYILAVLIAISALLGGCSDSKGSAAPGEDIQAADTPIATAAPEITPTPTAEPTPTPTPTPEPTATPEPTPFVRTSYTVPNEGYIKTEFAKLGFVPDDGEYRLAYNYSCLFFEKDGQPFSMNVWTPDIDNNKQKQFTIKDLYSNEELFSFKVSDCDSHYKKEDIIVFDNFKKITPISIFFEDVDVLSIKLSLVWFHYANLYAKPYMSETAWKKALEEITQGDTTRYSTATHRYSREEMARFYIKYCPPENRINMYDLHPELND